MYRAFHLVGHRLCPYVQRVAMMMAKNNIPHRRTDILLDDKPDWFLKLSPTGNVPILIIDDHKVLFEADAICTYLDDLSWKHILPGDAYEKALHHGLIAIGGQILSRTADLIYRDLSEDMVDVTLHQIHKQLEIVASLHKPKPIAERDELGLLDMVFATVFRPFPLISLALNRDLYAGFKYLNAWSQDLAAHQHVKQAVPVSYLTEMHSFVSQKSGYLAGRLQMIPPETTMLAKEDTSNVISI